ncbi:MAG: AAA family ATPase [Phenylobacterium sp.]|uniref:AAA family ATPase n=1 Tax=Phenylobacterium sp. TaxID=1871053 RepID=UPI001A55F221|nr:AAA family ATPase [Phenylobacterium sp.]MBL8556676.1 AAA family ATPase [Phenylobacterium sp.]
MAPCVFIITGLMASGKSTVAEELARRFARSVHVRGDLFRRMVVSGRADMTPDPSPEASAQLALRYDLACATVDAYAAAGFDVVYQDVILGPRLAAIAQRLANWNPDVIVLDPSLDVVAQRDRDRDKTAYRGAWTPAALATALDETPRLGLWLDTSGLSVAQTVDHIVHHFGLTPRTRGETP